MTTAQLFNFLAACFLYPEDEKTRHRLSTLLDLGQDLEVATSADNGQLPALIELQTAYVHLFINGPAGVAAPPYASVYIRSSGLLRQQGFEEAIRFYHQAGLEPATSEPGDHIASELAFIALLAEKEEEALLADFITTHLNRWYPAFANRLLQAEPIFPYKILAQVTGLCLQHLSKEVMHEQKTFS